MPDCQLLAFGFKARCDFGRKRSREGNYSEVQSDIDSLDTVSLGFTSLDLTQFCMRGEF